MLMFASRMTATMVRYSTTGRSLNMRSSAVTLKCCLAVRAPRTPNCRSQSSAGRNPAPAEPGGWESAEGPVAAVEFGAEILELPNQEPGRLL
jgi:hypothetical protein